MRQLAASLERSSKHPFARPIVEAAAGEHLPLLDATEVREQPGHGLQGQVEDHVHVIGRVQAEAAGLINDLPPMSSG